MVRERHVCFAEISTSSLVAPSKPPCPPPPPMGVEEVPEITAQLAKKSTFIAGARRLTTVVADFYGDSEPAAQELVFNACKRAFTLLCSRYTAVGFWRVGNELFAAINTAACAEPARSKLASEWLARAADEVGKGEEASRGSEGEAKQEQGASAELPPADRPPRHVQASGNGDGHSPELLASIFENFVQDVDVERLISLIELQGTGAGSDSGPPPASREARFNLDMRTIKDKDVMCCVCQEEFPPGSKAKMMPCGHPFHYECLLEWLQRHNTCPQCRYALPSENSAFDLSQERVVSRDVAGTQLYS